MKTILAVLSLALAACVSTPSGVASAVKEADPALVANCAFLGTVLGRSILGGITDAAATNAMIDAREKAGAMGATHVVFAAIDGGGTYTTGQATGRAYRCTK